MEIDMNWKKSRDTLNFDKPNSLSLSLHFVFDGTNLYIWKIHRRFISEMSFRIFISKQRTTGNFNRRPCKIEQSHIPLRLIDFIFR